MEPPIDPGPDWPRADSIMSLPISEKELDAVADETDFLRSARGDGGRTSDADRSALVARRDWWYSMRVDRKHSSHCA